MVIQGVAQIEADVLCCHTPTCFAAVVEGVAGYCQQTLDVEIAVAIVKSVGGHEGIAHLR